MSFTLQQSFTPKFTPTRNITMGIKKYEVVFPLGRKQRYITTTVTTDKTHLTKWVKREKECGGDVVGFNLHSKEKKDGSGFLNTLILSSPEASLIFQKISAHGKFRVPLQLVHYLEEKILVGNNVKDMERSLENIFAPRQRELLRIEDLAIQLASYDLKLDVESRARKILAMEEDSLRWEENLSNRDKDLCADQDEKIVEYITTVGQLQFNWGKGLVV